MNHHYYNVSDKLKNDKKIVLKAVKSDKWTLKITEKLF